MNLSEFKAWFEGFTENLDGAPNSRQWARIVEKVGKIKDAPPVPVHIFHDHYYQPWKRWYTNTPIDCFRIGAVGSKTLASNSASPFDATAPFDSSSAFRALGQAEARSIR